MSADDRETSVEDYAHGRVPRVVRERQILALAEELFAERGYEGASMEELARRAGVTKPVVYSLVASKEELFTRCFERAGAELAERVTAAAAEHGGDLEAELRATGLAFFRFVDEHEQAWRVLYDLDTGGRTAAALAKIRARQAEFVAGRLAEIGIEPPRAQALAHVLNGAFEALAHWRRDNPDATSAQMADLIADFALPGIRALAPGR